MGYMNNMDLSWLLINICEGINMNETKFNGMGEIYAKFRPSYAKNFIDYLYFV